MMTSRLSPNSGRAQTPAVTSQCTRLRLLSLLCSTFCASPQVTKTWRIRCLKRIRSAWLLFHITMIANCVQIRAKRLAKLGSQANNSQESSRDTQKPPTSSAPAEPPKPQININRQDQKPQNPFNQLAPKTDGSAGASRSATPMSATPAKRDSSSTPRHSTPESIESWEDKMLGNLFRTTLNPSKTTDVHGHQLYFLDGVRAELEQEQTPIRMTTGLLEQALIESGSNQGKTKPLDYFLACWKRIARQLRSMRGGNNDDPKLVIVKEARRLCMSYCIFAITIPDMFGQDSSSMTPLAHHLLVDPENDRGICHDFLTEAVARFDEDDSIKVALVEAMEQLSRELSKLSMNDNYKPYVMVC